MFNKIWARYIDLATGLEWQGILCLEIGETLQDYCHKNKIRIIETNVNIND